MKQPLWMHRNIIPLFLCRTLQNNIFCIFPTPFIRLQRILMHYYYFYCYYYLFFRLQMCGKGLTTTCLQTWSLNSLQSNFRHAMKMVTTVRCWRINVRDQGNRIIVTWHRHGGVNMVYSLILRLRSKILTLPPKLKCDVIETYKWSMSDLFSTWIREFKGETLDNSVDTIPLQSCYYSSMS